MKYTRRSFIKTGTIGLGGLWLTGSAGIRQTQQFHDPYEIVEIGRTGIKTTRLCMGTGIRASGGVSNLTRSGHENSVQLIREIYGRGVRMFDAADSYGTHTILGDALKVYPRRDFTIFTKIWFATRDAERVNIDAVVDRFLKELQTDYIDGVLLHCLTTGEWVTELSDYMEAIDRLKQKGVIRAHGVSCHSLDAMKAAALEPWVDTCHCRYNPFGPRMDDTVENVAPVVTQLHKAGKGVIGMKIYGEGTFANDPEKKNQSLKYLLHSGDVDILDIGMDKMSDLTDTEERIRLVNRINA
ncbi:MAG: aldo/keto reductase [Tannerellaceae bacterium]|nr:aldo/keto reductase [Tannerellaceae bacterium]